MFPLNNMSTWIDFSSFSIQAKVIEAFYEENSIMFGWHQLPDLIHALSSITTPYLSPHIFGGIGNFKSLTQRTDDKEPVIVLQKVELLMLKGLIFGDFNFGVFGLPIANSHDHGVIKGTLNDVLLIWVEVTFMFVFMVNTNVWEALMHVKQWYGYVWFFIY